MTDTTIELDQTTTAQSSVGLEPVYIHIGVTDPDVLAALKEYEIGQDRTRFVELALKVGVLSLRAAKGVIDGEQIKASGDQLISQLTERLQSHRELIDQSLEGTLRAYFDPSTGHFAARVTSLTNEDGELSLLVRRQITSESEKLKSVLDSFVGNEGALSKLLAPGEQNPMIADLQKRLQQSLNDEREAIISQFSLDSESSALSRLVRELQKNHGDLTHAMSTKVAEVVSEFSLDRPDSALSRLVGRVETAQTQITNEFSLDHPESALNRLSKQLSESIDAGQRNQSEFQNSVLQILSGLQAQKKAEARSTTHGEVFEKRVGEMLADQCTRAGDVLDDTGTTTGLIRMCKVGDFTITLGADNAAAGASIVVEAKESSSYSVKSTLAECDEARRNRGSQVCLFVHSVKTAPVGFETISRQGNDIVVVWDAEDSASDVALKAGLLMARALCVRQAHQSSKETASWTLIDKAIENMRKQIANFADLRTISETIERSAEKSLERIRIMSKGLDESLSTMEDQITGLRSTEQLI